MFTKVLVVDDIDFNDAGAIQVLKKLKINTVEYVKYCDDALLKLKKASLDEMPYQLLISDLSFKKDHREIDINSGEELIDIVKKTFPEIKIIAFSIEDKSFPIKSLFEKYDINGYVIKGRHTMAELKTAIETIATSDEKYISQELAHILRDNTINEINSYDIKIIKYLSNGVSQGEMESRFLEDGIKPSSKSTIEKHINRLKIYFKANNTTHLVSIAKDLGLV